MKIKIDLGSVIPLSAWDLLKAFVLMPVSLLATRCTAMSRSRWVKKGALEGESGRQNQMTKAHRQVAPPSWNGVSERALGFPGL